MEERCVKSSFLTAAIRFTCIAVMQAFRLIRAFSRDNRGPTKPRWSVVNIFFLCFCIARSQRKSGLKEPCTLYLPVLIFSNQAVDIEESCILMMNTNMPVWPPLIASTVISSNRFPRYDMQRLEMPDSVAPSPWARRQRFKSEPTYAAWNMTYVLRSENLAHIQSRLAALIRECRILLSHDLSKW